MLHYQKAFTLIELMIVIAIIGVIAAIALPAYSDYSGKAQLVEALTLASGQKTPISEFYSDNGKCPQNASESVGGIAKSTDIIGKYVISVTTDNASITSFTFNGVSLVGKCEVKTQMRTNGVNRSVRNGILILTMAQTSGAFIWHCSSPNINKIYLPKNCQ